MILQLSIEPRLQMQPYNKKDIVWIPYILWVNIVSYIVRNIHIGTVLDDYSANLNISLRSRNM